MKIAEIHNLVAAVCPIEGINSEGVISFAETATVEQQAAAQAVMDANLPTLDAPSTLAQLRVSRVKEIDADTDALIGAVIGNRASEYERAESQATAFAAGGYAGDVPECVDSWAVAKGWNVQHAADDILATAAAWRTAQAAIRAARLLRKEQVRGAADEAAVDVAMGQWTAFLKGIRTALGVS